MRVSFVLFVCLAIAMASSASVKTTRRRAVTTTERATTKAPKSAYAYLRTVRGKASCVEGSCPFWERHGRSFTALRCYSQQYQECTCLHRMCFSSCMFSRNVCNNEMASCLRQICPRCIPASASAMCAVYDSMADQVANALSAFACYPCCPNINGASNSNSSGTAGATISPAFETTTVDPFAPTDDSLFIDPSATDYPEGNYYPGNENPSGTDDFSGQNQNGNYPSNNGNTAGFNNGNNNGYSNGNDNGYSNSNSNGYSNTGFSNGNGNDYSNTNGNGYSNVNTNTNSNGYSNVNTNTNSNGYSNVNTNTNSNGYSNVNTNTNSNGYSNVNTNTNSNGYSNVNTNTNSNGYSNVNTNTNSNGYSNGNTNANTNINGYSNGNVNTNGNVYSNGNTNGASNANNNGASNGNANTGANVNGNGSGSSGNCNVVNAYPGVVFPGSDAMFYNNNFPNRNQQAIRQRARQTVRTTKRHPTTTRRTPVTTRRLVQAIVTVRGNNIKSGVRNTLQTQKNTTSRSSY